MLVGTRKIIIFSCVLDKAFVPGPVGEGIQDILLCHYFITRVGKPGGILCIIITDLYLLHNTYVNAHNALINSWKGQQSGLGRMLSCL